MLEKMTTSRKSEDDIMPPESEPVEKPELVRTDEEYEQLLELGERLLAARTAAKMTQAALAIEAEVTPRFIQKIESGQGNPSYLKVLAIARALGRHGRNLM